MARRLHQHLAWYAFRDFDGVVTTERILDVRITLPNGERTTLSDHYGVLATLR